MPETRPATLSLAGVGAVLELFGAFNELAGLLSGCGVSVDAKGAARRGGTLVANGAGDALY